MPSPSRRNLIAASAAGLIAAPAIARAQTQPVTWRMVTSWAKNLPGPGVSAERLAQRINAMSGGRLRVDVFPAGHIVPAFGVLDAVSTGVAEMGHTASFFWDGQLPGAAFFTTAPFGMGALAHQTWIEHRGGQQLWDELYRPRGVRGLLAGNTGPSMGGWFRKPVESLADIKGLRIRVQGMGGEVYAALGATPQSIPPADIYPALERGTIDAVEILAPVNDLPLGLHRIAPYLLHARLQQAERRRRGAGLARRLRQALARPAAHRRKRLPGGAFGGAGGSRAPERRSPHRTGEGGRQGQRISRRCDEGGAREGRRGHRREGEGLACGGPHRRLVARRAERGRPLGARGRLHGAPASRRVSATVRMNPARPCVIVGNGGFHGRTETHG